MLIFSFANQYNAYQSTIIPPQAFFAVFCLNWGMIYVIFKGNNGGVIRQKGISPFGVVFFRLKAVVT